jgi:hypothetical protein
VENTGKKGNERKLSVFHYKVEERKMGGKKIMRHAFSTRAHKKIFSTNWREKSGGVGH